MCRRSAVLLLALAGAASLLSLALGAGTIISLHPKPFFGGATTVWVVPDPTNSTANASYGCTDLPAGFQFQSSRFYWNDTTGLAQCHFIWFFFDAGCQGGARGVEVIPKPTGANESWVSQDPILSRTTYWKIMNGKSVGCSFEVDPCIEFPCSDPHAVCNSTLGWSWKDDAGKSWAQQTRNCSTCEAGYVMSEGKCALASEACAKVKCTSPAVCETDPAKGAYCACPAGYQQNNVTGACTYSAQDAWLPSINSVRAKASVSSAGGPQKTAVSKPTDVAWAANLAVIAQNWTDYTSAQNCNKANIVLSKMGSPDYSESDVWVSWTADESAAVNLWAPQPSDSSNPRTDRMTNVATQYVGCGKTVCGPGAFFTCLFWPKTV